MATEYATLVFKADTQELGQAYNQLKKLNEQGKITDKTLKSFETQMKGIRGAAGGAGKGLQNMGRGAGQAGIQVQQFVGQVQAGTNPMLAFSQQAADLGIVLGAPMLGVIAALGASLGMVLLPQLLSGSRALKDFDEVAKELDISLRTDAPALYAARLKDLEQKENEAREAIQKTEKALIAEQERLAKVTDEVDRGILPRASLRNQTVRFEEAEAELLVTLDKERIALKEAITATRDFASAKTEAEKAAEDQAEGIRQLVLDLTLQEQKLIMGEQAFGVYEAQLKGADQAVSDFVRTTLKNIEALKEQEKASKATDRFLEKLEKQAGTFKLSRSEALMLESATLSLSDTEKERVAVLIQQIALEEQRTEKMKEAKAAQKELVQMGLLDAERDEIDSLMRRSEKLEEFRAKDLISEQQYAEAKKNIEKDQRDFAIKSAGDALNQLGQVNKQAFKAAKAYNIGQAIMNTYTGATKALAELPPPLNFIVAAATVASGLAQVQQIRSQQYSGRALGGQVRGGESYVVGERGPEVLTMGSNGRIIPNDKLSAPSQTNNQNVSVSFNITATDASGFDQLLQARRGMIIGMINQAMNNRGRKALV
jgi:hypothetical protein